ncbi:monocarboxylate transporter 12-B-like isoform X2 [Littorina saxatilis]|uniref:Major facilitator superfamily (MFS) profile domain-containing protein n=1 Tax=Littorina saxatilis TaxID=31220 RepID=A0AAN9AP95_9CAEN
MAKQPFPLDRGWAWAIVFGSFVCVFFMVGTAKSTGMFLPEFQKHFNVSTSLASMVMGGSAIVYALAAPFCILLGQIFTVRKVIIIGGIIGFVGMALGSLLFSMEYVIAVWGVCFGIGNATIYGNCLVIMGYYFHKRRTLANGLALTGSSIGQFTLPPFIEFLLETYGLQGCILILAGVYFNVVAAASLFRPPSFWASPEDAVISLHDEEEAGGEGDQISKGDGHLLINGKISPEDKTNSVDSSVNDRNVSVVANNNGAENVVQKSVSLEEDAVEGNNLTFDGDSADSPLVSPSKEVAFKDSEESTRSPKKMVRYHSYMASTGSLCMRPLSMYGSSMFGEAHDMQIEELEEEKGEKQGGVSQICQQARDMFDFSVMKSYVAVFTTITNFLSFFGYFNFVLFLPAAVLAKGITKYDKALLVSLCGIGDLVGRLLTAFIGDRAFVSHYKMQAVGILALSVNIGLFIFADSFAWMAVHTMLYGFFGGINVSLAAVVIIDFVGLKNMPRLLAVVMLIQGVGASIGQPLLGGVKDATGSFDLVLVICTVSGLLAGILLLCYPLAVKLEYRRPERYRLLPQVDIATETVSVP